MAMHPIGLTGESSPLLATDITAERTINFYPVIGESDPNSLIKTAPLYLYSTEGSSLYVENAGNKVRGCIEVQEVGYYVVDSTVYRFDSVSMTRSILGTLGTTSGLVCFADINDQVMLVDGNSGYIYTISTGVFAQIVDVDFPSTCTTVTSLDGYFVVTDPNTQRVRISSLNDGKTWAALDFGLSQQESDNLVRIIAQGENLWCFGTHTTEQFFDSGNVLFPFNPVRGSTLYYGLAAPFGLAKTDTGMIFLSRSARGSIAPCLVKDNTVSFLFNTGIIEEISRFPVYADCIAFVYTQSGHQFAVFTFPTANKTYVFDLTANVLKSHERQSLNTATAAQGHWFPSCYMNLGNKHIVGDYFSGNLYELKTDVYTEKGGNTITRQRRTPLLIRKLDIGGKSFIGSNYKTVNKLLIRVQTGSALTEGQGSDPQIMLQLSRDGGHTFDVEMWRSVGTYGEYNDIAVWDGLGTSRKWCGRVVVTDPIDWKILEAYADVSEGSN